MDKPRMPVAGEFVAEGGFKVVVRSATLRQSLDLQIANGADNAKAISALVAFVCAVAEVEGVDDVAAVLTSRDCENVVRLASSGGVADFH